MDTSIVHDFERLLNTRYDSLQSDIMNADVDIRSESHVNLSDGEHGSRISQQIHRSHDSQTPYTDYPLQSLVYQHNKTPGYATPDAASKSTSTRSVCNTNSLIVTQQHPATLKRRRYRKRRNRTFLNMSNTNPGSHYYISSIVVFNKIFSIIS